MSEENSDRKSLGHRLGEWLMKDRDEQDADLARLMRYNILISFLTFCVVARPNTLADVVSLIPLV